MRLYVGNLPWTMTDFELGELFAQYGEVSHAIIIVDFETGGSRGFGFVTMPDEEDARKAIAVLEGKEFQGRPLRVRVAISGSRSPQIRRLGPRPLNSGSKT